MSRSHAIDITRAWEEWKREFWRVLFSFSIINSGERVCRGQHALPSVRFRRQPDRKCLSLNRDAQIRVGHTDRRPLGGLQTLLAWLRSAGAVGSTSFASPTVPGWGFHHVGCLPMRRAPAVQAEVAPGWPTGQRPFLNDS
jgi:hypothetical protein